MERSSEASSTILITAISLNQEVKMNVKKISPAVVAIILVASTPQMGQNQTALRRTDLLKRDMSVPGHEIVQVRVDFEPGASSIRHRHPGEEVAYVLSGRIEYQLGSDIPITVEEGDALFIPDGVAHTARNVGQGPASELATYAVRKDAILVDAVE
jgi:quercetin dioxygenase-like cupin family protein